LSVGDLAATEYGTPLARPFAQAPPDPWAHRRGEPRVFAFLWTMYVLLAVGGSILWVARFAALSSSAYSPAARVMLVVVAVGATILWPMVRLSQASPRKGVMGHVLADSIIVLTPIQLVLWPMIVLANWPLGVIAAVAGLLAAWVVLTGGVLSLALAGPGAMRAGDPALAERTAWMVAVIALAVAGPLAIFACNAAQSPVPPWLAMLSPLTAVPLLTGKGLSGPQTPVTALEMRIIALTGAAGLVFWVLASVRSALGRRSDRE
jgi:hypothetical protein